MVFFLFFSVHLIGFLNANTDRNAKSPANYGLMVKKILLLTQLTL